MLAAGITGPPCGPGGGTWGSWGCAFGPGGGGGGGARPQRGLGFPTSPGTSIRGGGMATIAAPAKLAGRGRILRRTSLWTGTVKAIYAE